MFCQNCGKQIPNNSKFCNGCGAQIASAASAQQTNYGAASNTGSQPKKKKGGILGVILISLLVFFGAKGCGQAMAESYVNVKNKETTPPTIAIETIAPTETVVATVNPDYSKVFMDRSILFIPEVFFGLESDCYVYVSEDGIVDHQQFGHKDNIVVEFVETVFVMTEGWPQEQKDEYVKIIQETYGNAGLSFGKLDDVTVTDTYISFALVLKEMDNVENIRAAADAEFITISDGYSLWGMSDSEEALLAEGYIKR